VSSTSFWAPAFGIVNPLVMPAMTVVLVSVLWWFDRPTRILT